jgi:hypothetical protein
VPIRIEAVPAARTAATGSAATETVAGEAEQEDAASPAARAAAARPARADVFVRGFVRGARAVTTVTHLLCGAARRRELPEKRL